MLSICIIGSQARQTADDLSDRDVLFVAPASKVLDAVSANWRSKGWNVSVFDRFAFRRLAEVQSLFVQHVKQEGRIVRDDDGFLACTFDGFSPRTDYLGERNDALRHIAALPPVNGKYWHDLCLADVTYVFFRNAAILHLASSGRYCFGFKELVAAVASEFGFELSEQRAVLALRKLKHAYRQRLLDAPDLALLTAAQAAISRFHAALSDLHQSSIEDGTTTNEYLLQRLEELSFASTFTPPVLDALGPNDPLFERWQHMKGCGGYPKLRATFH